MKKSAGILMYHLLNGGLRVLLVHSNGREDIEAWSIPKGEFDPSKESPEEAAIREVQEELGVTVPQDELIPLGECVYRNKGKRVYGFGWETEPEVPLSPDPREIALAQYFAVEQAKTKIHMAQKVFLDRLESFVAGH